MHSQIDRVLLLQVFSVNLFLTWNLYRIADTKVLYKIANVDTG